MVLWALVRQYSEILEGVPYSSSWGFYILYLFMYMGVCLHACLVPGVFLVPAEIQRGCQISWN